MPSQASAYPAGVGLDSPAGQPVQPSGYPARPGAVGPPPGKRRRGGRVFGVIVLLLVLALAWPVGLAVWAGGRLHHVEALSTSPTTPGQTYLIAGSDGRGSGGISDGTEGSRSDTIMILNLPPSGKPALMSIPRDTYVQIPGYGMDKINASFSAKYPDGGPGLLVRTVEGLTGFHIDHYVEVGFGSVQDLVDAVGGVELCLDYVVDDWRSGLRWDEPGCRDTDGAMALAFSRMRYGDPTGDIGRTGRQRQVIGAVMQEVATPATIFKPTLQVDAIRAATDAVAVDENATIVTLARLALGFRSATGPDGAMGTPTIADIGYDPGIGIGSTVLLDEAQAEADFRAVEAGTWTGNAISID